jgi:DNA primase
VVEGYTDVMALAQAGVENVVASMGTALTEQQLARLKRLTANVYLCFDADAAGLGAMSRALRLGRKVGLSLRVVRIPDGLDPADFVQAGGDAAAFARLADEAQTLLQFHVHTALAAHDLDRPDGRARAFAQLREVLAEAATPMERDEELRTIADRLQLSTESVRYLLAGTGPAAAPQQPAAAEQAGTRRATGGSYDLEVRFLAACLACPERGREALGRVDEGFFATAETRAAFRAVAARLVPGAAGNTLQTAADAGTAAEAAGSEAGPALGEGGEAFAEVVVRAGREPFTPAVVDELFLRLQEAQLSRLIARLKVTVQADETGTQARELARLQQARQRLREALRSIPVDDGGGQP